MAAQQPVVDFGVSDGFTQKQMEKLNSNFNLIKYYLDSLKQQLNELDFDARIGQTAGGTAHAKFETVKAGVGTFDTIYGGTGEYTVLISKSAQVDDIQASKLYADSINTSVITAPSGDFDQIVADSVTAENIIVDGQIVANAVKIKKAELTELNADVATFGELASKFARFDFANINGAEIAAAKMQELFAASGWFNNITITGDQDITGQLKSILIDGDTARFKNIYADAVKILGEDGLYHVLNFMGLPEDKEDVYTLVTPAGTENPREEEWYVLVDGEYVLTDDETVQAGTDYYSWSWRYENEATRAYYEQYGESLDGGLHGSHIIAETITATQIDVSTLIASMLLAQTVQIGATGGIHTEMNGSRLSFLAGNYHLPDDMTGVTSETVLPGEVAYIAIDENTNESMFYMARAVVMKDLHFGQWQWKSMPNGNMVLKWIGG